MLRNTSALPAIADTRESFDAFAPAASRPGARHEAIRLSRPLTGPGRRSPAQVEVSPSPAVERLSMTGRGITVELVQSTSRSRIEFRYRGSSHLLVAYTQGVRRAGETFIDGKAPSTLRNFTRKLTFVPAGHDYFEWHQLNAAARLLLVYIDPVTVAPDVQSALAASGGPLDPRLFLEDATLWSTVVKLEGLIEDRQPDSLPYFQALGTVLMLELARLNGRADGGESHVRGGLAAWQRRLVASYVEEHLSEHISLATLARLARLSRYHFSRAFKQSFGLPPHRYHTNRRIERAKTLLEGQALSVTDIGLRLGFSETSAFTAVFRRTTGLTPSRYHRSVAHVVAEEAERPGPSGQS